MRNTNVLRSLALAVKVVHIYYFYFKIKNFMLEYMHGENPPNKGTPSLQDLAT